MRRDLNRGFTLIELMIVVAIIGILSAIAIANYSDMRTKTFIAATITATRSMELAQASFYTEYFQYAAVSTADSTSSGLVSKTITLNRGGTQIFTFSSNAEVGVLSKTGNGETTAIVAAKHTGADRLIAVDMDIGSKVYKLQSSALQDSDIPASTTTNDLSSWSLQ